METTFHPFPWLELIDRPAFCVKDGRIVAVNPAVEKQMLPLGTDISQILTEHQDLYNTFENGSLYLTVSVGGVPFPASITRTEQGDIFVLQQSEQDTQLKALALAAQQLRIPLSNIMAVSDRLLSSLDKSNAVTQQQANQINHNLFQLLRLVSNMSDAENYTNANTAAMQIADVTAVVDEIIEKAQTLSQNVGVRIQYNSLHTPVYTLTNTEKLERAIYNILSNALKFSPRDSVVHATLSKNNKQLTFAVCNQTDADITTHGFWQQYRRTPGIEDTRLGLGLGMTLISAVVALHKGAVLVDHPNANETRVTMTIPIIKDPSGTVQTPLVHIGDYAGGRDRGILELAEILGSEAYKDI